MLILYSLNYVNAIFYLGILCWTCSYASSNWECARKGRLQNCRDGEVRFILNTDDWGQG